MATITDATPLINISTNQYPVYLYTVRQAALALANPVSLPPVPSEAQINALGYAVVNTVAQPAGDVVTEGVPSESNGVYTQTWTSRSFTADEIATNLGNAKAAASTAVDNARIATFEIGMSYTFPDGTTQHVQMRDQDKINLLTIQSAAASLVAANDTTTTIPFRTYENNDLALTGAQAAAMCSATITYGTKVYQASFTLKNQIIAAADITAIPTIPGTITVS